MCVPERCRPWRMWDPSGTFYLSFLCRLLCHLWRRNEIVPVPKPPRFCVNSFALNDPFAVVWSLLFDLVHHAHTTTQWTFLARMPLRHDLFRFQKRKPTWGFELSSILQRTVESFDNVTGDDTVLRKHVHRHRRSTTPSAACYVCLTRTETAR